MKVSVQRPKLQRSTRARVITIRVVLEPEEYRALLNSDAARDMSAGAVNRARDAIKDLVYDELIEIMTSGREEGGDGGEV